MIWTFRAADDSRHAAAIVEQVEVLPNQYMSNLQLDLLLQKNASY